jgi:VIT1/CCC1 family predicted Fe2+/Mn2+ transporter
MSKNKMRDGYRWCGYLPEAMHLNATAYLIKKGITSESQFIKMAIKSFLEAENQSEKLHEDLIKKILRDVKQ